MRNDQELYQLFRARLPIATLPQDFADRLTKAVLDEVAQLRQEQPLTKACPNSDLAGPTPFNTLKPPQKPVSLPCTSKAMAVFVLLTFFLWPLMQGCTFPTIATSAQPLIPTDSHGISNPLADPASSQPDTKQLAAHKATMLDNLRSAAQPWRLPPLLPIQPQLPILQVRPRAFVSKSGLTLIATPSTDDQLINLHGPPGVTQTISTAMTITVPYETQTAPQDTLPEPTPIPPEQPQTESPTNATATPTTEMTLIKPTASPTVLALAPTPILSIFEPTATPGATTEEPTGAAPDMPTAIPTICILPWQPSESAPTSTPPVDETPTSAPVP